MRRVDSMGAQAFNVLPVIVYKASIFDSIKGLLAHHIDAEEVVTCQAVLFMLARDYISSLDMKKQESRTSDDSIEPPLDAEDPDAAVWERITLTQVMLDEALTFKLKLFCADYGRKHDVVDVIEHLVKLLYHGEEFSHSSAACESAVASAKKKPSLQ